jgi:hypothetical protein
VSTIQEIESAIERLSEADRVKLREWFLELDQMAWDRQLADDIAAGRLDSLVDEALDDLRKGSCTEL